MEGTRMVLQLARDHGLIPGHLRGLFHIAIGRKLTAADGTVLSMGMSWRDLSHLLKALKFDREIIRELGADPEALAPKDRERFWYSAIALAKVESAEARQEAEELTVSFKRLGIQVGPGPGGTPTAAVNERTKTTPEAVKPAAKASKRKKK